MSPLRNKNLAEDISIKPRTLYGLTEPQETATGPNVMDPQSSSVDSKTLYLTGLNGLSQTQPRPGGTQVESGLCRLLRGHVRFISSLKSPTLHLEPSNTDHNHLCLSGAETWVNAPTNALELCRSTAPHVRESTAASAAVNLGRCSFSRVSEQEMPLNHECGSWPSELWCQPEPPLVGSAVRPWCGSADTVSAAPPPPPPPACRRDSLRWPTANLRGSAAMHSSSSAPRPPLPQNEDASCGMLGPEGAACPPPPAAVKHRKTHFWCHWIHK